MIFCCDMPKISERLDASWIAHACGDGSGLLGVLMAAPLRAVVHETWAITKQKAGHARLIRFAGSNLRASLPHPAM